MVENYFSEEELEEIRKNNPHLRDLPSEELAQVVEVERLTQGQILGEPPHLDEG